METERRHVELRDTHDGLYRIKSDSFFHIFIALATNSCLRTYLPTNLVGEAEVPERSETNT